MPSSSFSACSGLYSAKLVWSRDELQITKLETLPNPDDFGKIIRGLQVYAWKVLQEQALITRPVTKA